MIVQCDKCTTKFRIADEKVTPNGVKVRCSRCAHVFVVSSAQVEERSNTDQVDPSVISALAASKVSSSTEAVAAALGFSGGTTSLVSGAGPSPSFGTQDTGEQTQRLNVPSSAPLDHQDFSDLDEAFRKALAESKDLAGPTDSLQKNPIMPASLPPLNPGVEHGNTPTRAYADEEEAGALLGALYLHGPKSSIAQTRFPPPAVEVSAPPAPKPQTEFPPPMTGSFRPMSTGDTDGGDIPGLLAPVDDDPFANIDVEAPLSSPSGMISDHRNSPLADVLSADDANSSLVDALIPFAPEPLEPPSQVVVHRESTPLAKLELARAEVPDFREPRPPEPTAVVRSYVPPSVDLEMTPGEGRWPTLAGILLGLMILVFLLPGLGQRAVEALLPPSWGVEWSGAVAPPTPVQVNLARVSAYPTDSGAPVLVVAGDARNRTEDFLEGVEVVVEMFDGVEKIEERRGLVDVVLTEGQLAAIKSPEELTAAYKDAVLAHGRRGVVLPPGIERPFMVVFPVVPDNATRLRYRVSFVVPTST